MKTNHIRCIKPLRPNKYFINTTQGGYSKNVIRNQRDGWVLPNCTGFASGWFNFEYNKLMGKDPGLTFDYFIFDAQNFWWQITSPDSKHYKALPFGQEPKEGGIMVWNDSKNIGHVAICDKVYPDGTIDYAESNYSGPEYRLEHYSNANGRWGMSSAYKYLGCIYNPAVKPVEPINPQSKKFMEDQIQVLSTTLRVRDAANLKGEIYGFAKPGFYHYLETKNADGYDWYRIADEQWVAAVKGATNIYPKSRVIQKFNLRDKVKLVEGATTYTNKPISLDLISKVWLVQGQPIKPMVILKSEDGLNSIIVKAIDVVKIDE